MNFRKAVLRALRLRGVNGTARSVISKFIPLPIRNLDLYRVALANSAGLEIGGPTSWFEDRGALPVYSVLRSLDNCTFATSTMWGTLPEGPTFRFAENKPPGKQFICEASDLRIIESDTYDCVLSSHALEHLANPTKGLLEWKRTIKEGGYLLLVVPHRDGTFDHKRAITPFRHILEDFEHNTREDDLTHLEDVLQLHDVSIDPGIPDIPELRERSLKNLENRCMHHHVFDSELVIRLLDYAGLQILSVDPALPCNINILSKKLRHTDRADNRSFLGPDANFRKRSPFKTDRVVSSSRGQS